MQPEEPKPPFSRRDLFRGAVAGTGAVVLSQLTQAAAAAQQGEGRSVIGMPFEPRENVRMGLIGCGERGSDMLKEYLGVDGLTVTAVCDVVKDAALHAQATVERAGQHPPAVTVNPSTPRYSFSMSEP